MSLFSTDPAVTAVVKLLNTHLPAGWKATDDGTVEVSTIIVEPVTSPNPEAPTLGGLPERASVLVQLTGHAPSYRKAIQAANTVREILTGRTGRTLTHPLHLDGYRFDAPVTLQDLRVSSSREVHRFTETYRITWQTDRTSDPS